MQPASRLPTAHIIVWLILACAALLVFVTSLGASAAGRDTAGALPQTALLTPSSTPSLTPSVTITPTITPTATPAAVLFMPYINLVKTPEVELLKVWSSDPAGGKLQAFMPGAAMVYHASGLNNLEEPAEIGLRWEQNGACNAGQIFSSTLSIPVGAWEQETPATAPTCSGVFSAMASLKYDYIDTSEVTQFVVNRPGNIQISLQQGFDKCYAPSLSDMQTWWDDSPYVVYNLYLGGISFACKNDPLLDAVWVRQAAQQGWGFILTWVGPQAPCTSFTHKMSSDADEAYDEGKAEAQEAATKAKTLGFFGPKVIYYDLEAFPNASNSCKRAADAFIRGWAEQLAALGHRSGAYGSPCNSYIRDWADNNPPPDNVWIAHWIAKKYDPDATVWDTPCLDNGLWSQHQRIKQYAGGHKETWGGESLTIDSNVLDGEINLLEAPAEAASRFSGEFTLDTIGPQLRDAGLVSSDVGWVLADEHLLWTSDSGASWQEITSSKYAGGRILAVAFEDAGRGWAAGMAAGESALSVARTVDGGRTWQTAPVTPVNAQAILEIKSAQIAIIDEQTIYLAVKLPSSSSFSLGGLYASQDGGATWEVRSLPLGEKVVFLDSSRGWTAGGAAGDQLFRTLDGGITWQEVDLPLEDGQQIEIGLPQFNSGEAGRLPVAAGDRLQVYTTQDGGETWRFDDSRALASEEFAWLAQDMPHGNQWSQLPEGAVMLDFAGDLSGWAIAAAGDCQGEKGAASPDGVPLRCIQVWRLLATSDGGQTWGEITPQN